MFILTGVSQTHTNTVLQYGRRRARTNILWKLTHTHTANFMKKQKKSNFRELKSEHNARAAMRANKTR